MSWFCGPSTDAELSAQEYEQAVDELSKATDLHAKMRIHCRNTDYAPSACGFCKDQLGDGLYVWRRIMIVNE